MSVSIPKKYDPSGVEERLYRQWEESGCFRPEARPQGEPFCTVIPPPNITGSLHMGHALQHTLLDVVTRWRRMQGRAMLWLPGVDHAGIACQNVVERYLLETEGLTRHDLGREAFVERVWKWKAECGDTIVRQMRRMGSSVDWSRLRFTMDEGLSRAVRTAFVRLYEEGLIYRGERIINWCVRCATALSDMEVEHEERDSKLYYIRYPGADGGEGLVVATTRPETMLGDTGVAVGRGTRYESLAGSHVVLPLMGRRIPVFVDERIEAGFGTGALKVTPAHDPVDFEIGRDHGLDSVTVIGLDGRMTGEAGPYAGLERYECREAVLRDLAAQGLLVKAEDHRHAVGTCYRCGTVIEPLVSLQWFVRMEPLAEPAIAAVEDGRVRFVPERWTGVFLDWMYNIRDWCISRQLWWGHRIPVWYCLDCGGQTVSMEDPQACAACSSTRIEQDEDVLDTWFSSALWPFSTLGWPDENAPDLVRFYPNDLLVTGYEIIGLWVSRMIMTGMHFLGAPPFPEVYIHGIVRDAKGRKMSKSHGNVVDPLDLVDRYGADAVRMGLAQLVSLGGQDILLSEERIEAARNFANKVWNAFRFISMAAERAPADWKGMLERGEWPRALSREDRWILSAARRAVEEITSCLERYRFADAATGIYEFIWHEFCDWYVEFVKPRLYEPAGEEERQAALWTLNRVFEVALRLLHPFMPFITEELRGHMPGVSGMTVLSDWPVPDELLLDDEAERAIALRKEVTTAARSLRAEWHVAPGVQARFFVVPPHGVGASSLEEDRAVIERLVSGSVRVAQPPEGERAVSAVTPSGATVKMLLAGAVDVEAERARLTEQIEKLEAEAARSQARLANPGFARKAPEEVVAREREKLADAQVRLARLREALEALS